MKNRNLLALRIFMGVFAFMIIAHSCQRYDVSDFEANLDKLGNSLFFEVAKFDGSHFLGNHLFPMNSRKQKLNLQIDEAKLEMDWDIQPDKKNNDLFSLKITVKVRKGVLNASTLGLLMRSDSWSTQNFVLFPAAAYNGNRYRGEIKKSKQIPCDVAPCGPDMEILLTDVPRLNYKDGPSTIQLLSGDMSMPAFSYRSDLVKGGMIIYTHQGNHIGDFSYKLEENADRSSAKLFIRMPGIREDTCFMGNRSYPSPDNPQRFQKGETLVLEYGFIFFDAPEIQDVFTQLMEIRGKIGTQDLSLHIPFSAAWKIQEDKYNSQNWVEEYGYYSVGMRENPYQNWQTGWTGGMNAVYPLLLNGSELTRKRAIQSFDFLFDTLTPAGFFFDVFHDGNWLENNNRAFLRRISDALYFIMKEFHLLENLKPGLIIPGHWHQAVKTCADGYLQLYENYGNFGHWVDNVTGEILAGPTASNGIAPAALALCAEYYSNDQYMAAAEGTAEFYYNQFVKKGISNGGPGDIWQCPDSESAFGLLESFVVLYEVTTDEKWLKYAEEMAAQAASWVVPYNFKFPEHSTFYKLGMQTTGTVIANVNNKHSAPGICTLSGNSLLKLYRYTGNDFYLDLIQDIAKSIPQYMSRADRPIADVRPGQPVVVMPPGWINERVNMSDWEERGSPGDIRRGEIFAGSCWSEVANMLSYSEIPGIYIEPDKKKVTVIDHVEASVKRWEKDRCSLHLKNTTAFNAEVRVMVEDADRRSIRQADHWLLEAEVITVAANSEVTREIIF